MFSQWRHAVENLAQHSPRGSQDTTTEEGSIRGSIDATSARPPTLPTSASLAEGALSSLRKTLIAQRPASPGIKPSSPSESAAAARSRTTLEDRLRAKFAIGDASAGTSPNPSIRSTPSSTPVPVIDHPLLPTPPTTEEHSTSTGATGDETTHPLSPTSTPLPDSPIVSPAMTIASPIPLSAIEPHPLSPPPTEESQVQEQSSQGITQEQPSSMSESVSSDTPAPQLDHSTSAAPDNIADASLERSSAEQESTFYQADEPSGTPSLDMNDASGDSEEKGMENQVELVAAMDEAHTDEHSTEIITEEPSEPSKTSLEQPAGILPDLSGTEQENVEQSELRLSSPDVVHPTEVIVAEGDKVDIEALQQRLKLVEQRFSDVSTSFKRLQAEKVAADRVLVEMTSVQSIQEADALRDYLQNMSLKTEMAQDEIKRLTGKLTRQEERIEELRDIHHLESKSQSDQIHKLRAQVDEAEALLKASHSSSEHLQEESAKRQAEIDKLHTEIEKMKTSQKDEEEKRVKAVSLLKTVRQKLVKAEKDRDDALKELQTTREKEKEERDKGTAERQKLQDEIEKVNKEHEVALQGLRTQFDKEVSGLKERHERELAALRGQYELEAITMKSLHTKETEMKSLRISDLESSVQILTREKDEIFDQLQMRQAELESSQTHLESLQSQVVELQYQLREANDRVSLLNDEISEARSMQLAKTPSSSASTEDITRLLAATESKYEARIADLRRRITSAEREREDMESDLSKRLTAKVKEVEQLKSAAELVSKSREEEEEKIDGLRKEIQTLHETSSTYERLIAELQLQAGKVGEVEAAAQAHITEVRLKLTNAQQQLAEAKAREAQVRTQNKTLREELRKVQSSVALLERQRNPGVGYWGSRTESATDIRSPTSSTSNLAQGSPTRAQSPALSEEEVNYEYLRNVILQFLEHKEMRPHLVRILSTILRFTPQETRRLISKV